MGNASRPWAVLGLLALWSSAAVAAGLEPREIASTPSNVAPELVAATAEEPVERGQPRPVLDGVGWVMGLPRRILLWDRRVANHDVSRTTEESVRAYLDANGLDHVKVRINQYAPLADWQRLRDNTTVAWPYRYTIGALSVAGEALLPGRVFGRDHYNPYTGTVHLFSDVPVIGLVECGHAKDHARRDLPGTYAFVTGLPVVNLWPQAIAIGDVLAYAERQEDSQLEEEAYEILYPSFGTSIAGDVGDFVPNVVGLPVMVGTVVAGHVAGRMKAGAIEPRDPGVPMPPVPDAEVPEVLTASGEEPLDGPELRR
jgi:hypothetical protein